ncbi:MAG: UDP-3-O-(3-hydroxymyristoyl)glucosamine N-acyltransferase [Flavobacteriales bacterium]
MKLPRPHTLSEIASLLNASFVGNPELSVTGINEIHVVEPGDVAFVDHPKYYDKTLESAASVVLINKQVDCPEGKGLILHDDPFSAFNFLSNHFRPFVQSSERIDSSANIDETASVHPSAAIGQHVSIGKNAIIHANVSIGNHCIIGDNVIIHANTAIGGDAFYYKKRPTGFDKLLSCGRVIIENDVEIGSSCTIDRGVTGDTIIGEGTKMDNLVHIAHDTRIGKRCLFAAQVGIAGCVTIEDEVTLWGQVGCIANVTIGKGAVVLAQSGIAKSLEAGKTYFGSPAVEARKKMRELAAISSLAK